MVFSPLVKKARVWGFFPPQKKGKQKEWTFLCKLRWKNCYPYGASTLSYESTDLPTNCFPPPPSQAQLSHGTWFQHIFRQHLTIERISGRVQQMPQDDWPVHDSSGGQPHGVGHQSVHKRIWGHKGLLIKVRKQLRILSFHKPTVQNHCSGSPVHCWCYRKWLNGHKSL